MRQLSGDQLIFEAALAIFYLLEAHTELIELVNQCGEGARHRIGQPRVIELGDLLSRALAFDDLARDADDRRPWRRRRDDHRASANPAVGADPYRSDDRRARADHDLVFDRRMALLFLQAGAAQRNALVHQDVVADLGRLTDHNAHPVIDEETPANRSARMNFDSGDEARNLTDEPRDELELVAPEPVGEAMDPDSVQAGVCEQSGSWLPPC